MIILKTQHQIDVMRDACVISARALKLAGEMVQPGVTTAEIDHAVRKYIEGCGAKPSFLNYNGYPASACISINNQVIHGIPTSKRVIKNGDIVSIDVGAYFNGYHGDNAATYGAGEISQQAQALLDATRQSLYEGIAAIKPGARLGDVSSAVQRYVEARNFSVVRDFVGHGVGANLHEDPSVPNFGTPSRGIRLAKGMTLAIEPMVNAGDYKVKMLPDGWTVETQDGSLSAHFEHTVAITESGPVIMTLPD